MKKLFFASILIGGFFILIPHLVMASDAIIAGTITHTDGTPVVDMYMYAEDATNGDLSYDNTDETGAYSITVTPGSYVVYNNGSTSQEISVGFIRSNQNVSVAADETATLNFTLNRRVRLLGSVYESDGSTPIYSAYINITNVNGYTYGSASAYSYANGSYNLIPSYENTVSATGLYDLHVTENGYFGRFIEDINLAEDDHDYTQNINMTKASTVSGQIKKSNGDGLSSATVVLTELNSTSYSPRTYYATSDTEGNYTISVYDLSDYNGTAVGSYTLQASKTNYFTKSTTLTISADESTVTNKNLTLPQSGKITGHIYKSNHTGLSGATISAEDGYGNTYTATSSSGGSYTLTGLRASTHYIVTVSKTNYVTKKMYNLSVTAGHTTSGKNFTLGSAKTFSGTIKKSSGSVLEGTTIYLYSLNKPRSDVADYSTTTDSSGHFSFTNIVSGKYRLKVSKTGYLPYKKESLNITSNQTNKTYKLNTASSIYGRVTFDNKAVAGSYIYVYSAYNDKDYGYSSTTTDNYGYYRINNLKSGSYKIKVVTTNYALKIVDKTLTSGQQTTLNIHLAAAGSISGYIFDSETNLPLYGYTVKVKGSPITTTTDSNGYYILDGLAAGNYKIYIASSLYKTMYYGGVEEATSATSINVIANHTSSSKNFFLKPR